MRTSLSDKATFFNLVNNYVGMVLLSMHYCFAQSGWLALLALAALTGFGAFTGDCLVTSYRLIEADNPARAPSYAEIGGRCLGPAGKWLVVVSVPPRELFRDPVHDHHHMGQHAAAAA